MATTQQISKDTTPLSNRSSGETRELYRQKYEAQLREWEAKMEEARARADKLSAQAKLDMMPHLETARERYEAARTRFQALGDAAEDGWDDVKRNADSAWTDFKASIEGAYDALRSQGKPRQS